MPAAQVNSPRAEIAGAADDTLTGDSRNGITAIYNQARVPGDAQHGGAPAESSRKPDDGTQRRRRPHTTTAVAECRTELKFATPLTYLAIDVSTGDLTAEDTEVIVNPTNRYLRHGAKAIATAAGPELTVECTEFIKAYEMLPTAHVTHTSARNLPRPIKYVIHAA